MGFDTHVHYHIHIHSPPPTMYIHTYTCAYTYIHTCLLYIVFPSHACHVSLCQYPRWLEAEEDGHAESDSEDEEGLWEEEEYQCPIDAVDPFVLFADVMNGGWVGGVGRCLVGERG